MLAAVRRKKIIPHADNLQTAYAGAFDIVRGNNSRSLPVLAHSRWLVGNRYVDSNVHAVDGDGECMVLHRSI